MKRTSKIITVILVFALSITMVFGLTACANDSTSIVTRPSANFNFLACSSDKVDKVTIYTDDFKDTASVYDVLKMAELKYGFGAEFGEYDMLTAVKKRGLIPNTLQYICIYTDQKPSDMTYVTTRKVDGITYYSASVSIKDLRLKPSVNYLFAIEQNEFFDKGIEISQTMPGIEENKYLSEPVIDGEFVYVTLGDKIMKLKANGDKFDVVKEAQMRGSNYFGMSAPIIAGDKIVTGVKGGLQAFDKDLNSLWYYKNEKGGDVTSPITYDIVNKDEYVYVGFGNNEGANDFVCINVKDENPSSVDELKNAEWKYEKQGGYYNNGVVIVKDYVIFPGTLNGGNAIVSLNKTSGEYMDGKVVDGVIKSSIVYEYELNSVFFTTEKGTLYRIYFSKEEESEGKFGANVNSVRTAKLKYEYTTCTPAIYKNRLYVSSGKQFDETTGAAMQVFNVDTMTEIYGVETDDPTMSKPVVRITDNDGVEEIFVFFTKNSKPGGIYYIVDTSVSKQGHYHTLYEPKGSQQNYCMSNIIFDKNGKIYYKNDSNTLFMYHLGINWIDNKF